MSKISGITRTASSDYKNGRSSPSAQNLAKIIRALPKYTCYLLDLQPDQLSNQIIPKK